MSRARGSLSPFNRVFLLGIAPLCAFLYLLIDSGPFLYEVLSRGQTIGRDFAVFWTASVLLRLGDALALFDPATYQPALEQVMGVDLAFMPFPYPPHSLLFVVALSVFPYLVALVLWLVGTFCLVPALLWRRVDQRWVMAIALLLSPAAAVNISTGQNGFLSAALLCGGLLCLERRPVLAGLLIGLLSYKPQLGLLIPLLLLSAGHWRAFWAATATVVLLILGSSLVLGTEAWTFFLTKTGPQQLALMEGGTGRFQFMVPTYFMSGRLLGLPLWQCWTLQAISAAMAALASIWAFRQPVPHQLKAALAMVAAFLASPYLLTYDMIIVMVAILLAGQCFVPKWWESVVCALAWLLPAAVLPATMPVGPIILTALFLVLLRRVLESRVGRVDQSHELAAASLTQTSSLRLSSDR